ncbi:MAG: deoxyribose-phosphate aldolase [Schwartzia sp.]|nr:deoxyribose-phosphate aldolase [Schwartzia sp. (in: firmicutes)]
MKASEILSHVDHTLLAPTATWEEMKRLADEAVRYRTASVCVPPAYVARLRETYGGELNICTVIGFPLGCDTTAAKCAAAREAVENGADEIDAVMNRADMKNGDTKKITAEIAALKKAVGDRILKIIVEACDLTTEEKIAACRAVTEGGADFIKTSTGFGKSGATHEDVDLFRAHIGENVRIKAAGGIRTVEDMEAYLAQGCDRIGASAAVRLLAEQADAEKKQHRKNVSRETMEHNLKTK